MTNLLGGLTLPGLRASGVGRGGGGGGGGALALPITYGWNLADAAPTLGDDQDFDGWHGDEVVHVDSPFAVAACDGHTPSDAFSGSIRIDNNTTHNMGLRYNGFANRGQSFDMSQGLRIMMLTKAVYHTATGGSVQNIKAQAFGYRIYNHSQIGEAEPDGLFSYVWMNDNVPDALYFKRVIGGVSTDIDGWGALKSWTGDVKDGGLPWVAVGLEIGANIGSAAARLRTWGDTADVGAAHAGGRNLVLSDPSADYSGITFDTIDIRWGYNRTSGVGMNQELHWFWVGTASDDWPA